MSENLTRNDCVTKTVLVVDDDPDLRNIYSSAFQARGYRVLVGINGAEAFHLARRNLPDLILMDIRMPVMDAWSALSYIRALPETSHTAVWGISGFLGNEEVRDLAESRFDRIFPKPLNPADVIVAADAFLRLPSQDSGDSRSTVQ